MLDMLKQLALEAVKVYAILIGLYYGLGFALTSLNRYFPKIQAKVCPVAVMKRDMLQSTISLFFISVFLGAGTVLHNNGFGFSVSELGITNAALSFAASLLIFDAWFYWAHRLIHTKPLFKHVHKWHHLSRTPTVWSNNSDTFFDNCFLQSYYLFAHFLFPIHPYVLLAHKILDQVTGMIGHTGHEYASGRTEVRPYPLIAVIFHDQHHLYFKYNFATHFSIWDRLMGTLHPQYESELKSLKRMN